MEVIFFLAETFLEKQEMKLSRIFKVTKSAAKIPMFIGVDEEGGTVNRVSTNPNLRAVPFWVPSRTLWLKVALI